MSASDWNRTDKNKTNWIELSVDWNCTMPFDASNHDDSNYTNFITFKIVQGYFCAALSERATIFRFSLSERKDARSLCKFDEIESKFEYWSIAKTAVAFVNDYSYYVETEARRHFVYLFYLLTQKFVWPSLRLNHLSSVFTSNWVDEAMKGVITIPS